MTPSKQKITTLLADGRVFYIPFYQRAYVWNEKMWFRFIKDMEYISKNAEEYFFGSIILKDMGNEGEEWDRQIVIDGQQRLTTFALFMKVMGLLDPNIHLFERRFMRDDNSLTIRHSLADKEAFEKIASLKEREEIPNADNSNLLKAFNYFLTNVDISKIDVNNIMARTIFIIINLDNNENEHKIFDTINSLGVRLNTEELLKNHLFKESTLDKYIEIWKPVFEADEKTLSYWKEEISVVSSGKKSISDRFFYTLLQIIMHDPRNNINSEERKEFRLMREESLFNNYQMVIDRGNWDRLDFAREIKSYAVLFRNIFVRKDIQKDPESFKTPLKRILFIVFTLDVFSMLPYILYVLKNCHEEQEQNSIFSLLEAYIVRRLICNKISKNYSDLFTENLIGNQIKTYDALCKYLSAKKPSESLHMPYDIEVEKGFCNNTSLSSEKARAILYLLESKLRTREQTVLRPFNDYSLEHLMPQKWQENWPMPTGLSEIEQLKFKEERNKTINTLGNMTIITQGLNSAVSNYDWSNKLKQGLEDKCKGILTMETALAKPNWNEDEIALRAIWLAEKANEVWKNVISVDEEEELNIINRSQIDSSRYSLDGGVTYESKNAFVYHFVKSFMQKHPETTIKTLKSIFKDDYLKGFKRLGFICSEEEISNNTLKKGRKPTEDELRRWYKIDHEDAWLVSGDGIRFVVSSEITRDSADKVKQIAENDGWEILVKD
jgi:uncharacterized protein with ParB-like and HNH nuclease domain